MEQFKFTKKENKEDFTETAVFEARKECFPYYVVRGSSGHVFSQSSEEAKRKPSNYEKTQVRQFQWNWLTLFPWLRINMSCLNSDEEYDISYPYHQVKPPQLVPSLQCSAMSANSFQNHLFVEINPRKVEQTFSRLKLLRSMTRVKVM